jgi:hypothetical protein
MIEQSKINNNIPLNSENQNTSNISLFEARKFYYQETLKFVSEDILKDVLEKTTLKEIPFGDLYNNNAFYGVLDYEGDVVSPIENNTFFTTVGTANDKVLKLQNFVADAFNDMKDYLNRQAIKNAFSNQSAYFNLSIKKAFEGIDELYPATHLVTAHKFRSFILSDKQLDSKITDYKNFNQEYIKFLVDHLNILPVTKSGLALSLNLEIFSSGLIFSISEDLPDDDVNKYIKYYLDEGFICFSEACERFGFKFDKNLPFILFADLNSPAMKIYLNKYNLQDGKDVFNKRFKKLYLEDINQLKLMFYNSYNTFLIENTYYGQDYSNVCARDASKTILKERTSVSFEEYTREFPDSYWIKIYTYFKNLELSRGLTQKQFDSLVKYANSFVEIKNIKSALRIINNKFNQGAGAVYFDALQAKNKMLQQEQAVGVPDQPRIIL